LLRRYVSGHGYHILAVETAADALPLARELTPEVISIDLMLPGQDGLSLLQTIRSDPDTKDCPVIICSALEERELALSLGADCFLPKPVTQEDFLLALRTVSPG